MKDDPFKNFDNDKADSLLQHAESICDDEIDAAAHLAACLMALVPDLDLAINMIGYVEFQAAKAGA
jgi:hypothetical protein